MWLQLLKKSIAAAPRQAAARAVHQAPTITSLSLAALDRLAPAGHLKSAYPQTWDRIWLFCHQPAHLEKYLRSLSIRQRDGKRAGLSAEAMDEVADIFAANQRFLPAAARRKGWGAASLLR